MSHPFDAHVAGDANPLIGIELAQSITYQICDALSVGSLLINTWRCSQADHYPKFLHIHGFVHRDLKPANILLTTSGPGTENVLFIKLADFGLAKAMLPDVQLVVSELASSDVMENANGIR